METVFLLRGTILTDYYSLRQELDQFIRTIGELQKAHLLYGLGKLVMNAGDRNELDAFVKAVRPAFDPYANVRAAYYAWSGNADAYLQQFKKSEPIVKAFISEKSRVRRMLDRKKPAISTIFAGGQQLLVSLDRLQANSHVLAKQEKSRPELESKEPPYEILKNLEKRLRESIQTRLSAIDANWWKSRIPDDVRRTAEDRKSRRETIWTWLSGPDLHPIHYVDFTDYSKIISRRDNWDQVFKPLFADRDGIATRLKELEPIRNDIAHSRELSKKQRERLRLYADDIIDRLK
jgi:hypothetical protein